jgi:hypothetical protein
MVPSPIAAILGDPVKKRLAAQILGQAYFTAYVFIGQNRAAVQHIADVLVERREMHGDEVVDLLREVGLKRAKLDYLEERAWPRV